jgi:hypothetical protein
MDMLERRIREVFATLLAKGAKVLERTAGELAHAASELRSDADADADDTEHAWTDESKQEAQTMIRGAPLRAVPDTPTDEPDDEVGAVITPPGAPWTPPVEPPDVPEVERPSRVDAVVTPSEAGAPGQAASTDDRIAELASGTVSQIRAQLGDLSPDELRRLKETELASRRRTTLIAAIDRALTGAD